MQPSSTLPLHPHPTTLFLGFLLQEGKQTFCHFMGVEVTNSCQLLILHVLPRARPAFACTWLKAVRGKFSAGLDETLASSITSRATEFP